MSSVVVLTSRWAYWGERSLRDAIRLQVKGKVEVLRADKSRTITAGISRSGIRFKMPAPLVVRLLKFKGYKYENEEIKYSDDAVYERDKNICQYWHQDERGKRFKYRCTTEERTIDHVLPQSRGGKTSFDNCVCSCWTCNTKVKKNRTPKEAGLVLIRQPYTPKHRKGDMAYITFSFNPSSKAHQAYYEYMQVDFSHVV